VNKAELVAHVAKESDLSKDAAEKAVDATFKNIEKALKGRRRGADPGFPRAEIPRRQGAQRGLQQLGLKRTEPFRGGALLLQARLRLYCFAALTEQDLLAIGIVEANGRRTAAVIDAGSPIESATFEPHFFARDGD
jgi:hypothetical protein